MHSDLKKIMYRFKHLHDIHAYFQSPLRNGLNIDLLVNIKKKLRYLSWMWVALNE